MRERIYLADRETVLNLNKEIIKDVPVAAGEIIEAGDSVFMGRNHKAYKDADFGLNPVLENNSFIHHGVLLDQWVIGDRVFTLSKKQTTYYYIDLHVYRANQEKELILEYAQEKLIPTATNLSATYIERTILSDNQIQLGYYENSSLTLLTINLTRDALGKVVDANTSDAYVMTEQLNCFRLEKVNENSFLLLHCPSTYNSNSRQAHIRYCSWVDGQLVMGDYYNSFEGTAIRESSLILHPLGASRFIAASVSYATPYRILLNVVEITAGEITLGTHLEHDVGSTTPYFRSDHSLEGDKFCITYFIGGVGYATAYKVEGLTITIKNTLSNFGYNHVSPSSKYSKYNRNMKLADNTFIFFNNYGSSNSYYDGLWVFGFNNEDNVEQIDNVNFYYAEGSAGTLSRFTDNSILWCKTSVSGNSKYIILTEVLLGAEGIETDDIANYTYAESDYFKCQSNFEADYIEGVGALSRIDYNFRERQSSKYGLNTRNCLGIIGEDGGKFTTGPDLVGNRVKLLFLGDKILLVYAGVLTHYIEGILFKQEGTSWVQEKHVKFTGNLKVCRHFDAVLLDDETLVVAYTSNWVAGDISKETVGHTVFDISDMDNIAIVGSKSTSNYYVQVSGNRINMHRISDENYVLTYVGFQTDKNVLFYFVYQLSAGEVTLLKNPVINPGNSLQGFDCIRSQNRFLIRFHYYSSQTQYRYYEFDPKSMEFIEINALQKSQTTDVLLSSKSLYDSIFLDQRGTWVETYLLNVERKLTDASSSPKYYDRYLLVRYYQTADYSLLAEKHHPIEMPYPMLTCSDVFTLPVTESSFLKVLKNGGVYKGFLVSFDADSLSSQVEALDLGNDIFGAFTATLVPVDESLPVLLLSSDNTNVDTYVYSGIFAKSAIVLNRKVNRPFGIALSNGTEGVIDVITTGIIDSIYSDLLPGADYYVGNDGRPALAPNDFYLGRALSKDSLDIKGGI